jgi:hypothetical protein
MAYDDVGLFGLDEYGNPEGMHGFYGAAIGAGVSSLAAVAVREMASAPAAGDFDWKRNSALIGTLAGVAAGGVMAVFPNTRHAGWVAILAAVLSQGITALEVFLSSKPVFALGGVVLRNRPRVGGLGNAVLQPRNALRGPHLLGNGANMARAYGNSMFRAA